MYTPAQASKHFGVSKETLRVWHEEGKLRAVTTTGGHRRYVIDSTNANTTPEKRSFVYARVSSAKQEEDLKRVEFLQARYPNHEVVTDTGSGLNFKRKGLLTILELLCKGNVKQVVVAHRDRLVRFGFELLEFVFRQHRAILTVAEDKGNHEPVEDLKDDLLSIITVFTARYYGSRKYRRPVSFPSGTKRIRVLQKNKNLSKPSPKGIV